MTDFYYNNALDIVLEKSFFDFLREGNNHNRSLGGTLGNGCSSCPPADGGGFSL